MIALIVITHIGENSGYIFQNDIPFVSKMYRIKEYH